MKDTKVKIYVKTAAEILDRCFTASKAVSDSEYSGLSQALARRFPDNRIEAKYLMNINSRIQAKLKDGIPYDRIGFAEPFLQTLTHFIGIPDYRAFDRAFGPPQFRPVLFTRKPYGRMTFIRVPSAGRLVGESGKQWRCDADIESFGGEATGAQAFTMSGDRYPYWVELSYRTASGLEKVYLADDTDGPLSIVTPSHPLLAFFLDLASR